MKTNDSPIWTKDWGNNMKERRVGFIKKILGSKMSVSLFVIHTQNKYYSFWQFKEPSGFK
jgi:hypothetical protein